MPMHMHHSSHHSSHIHHQSMHMHHTHTSSGWNGGWGHWTPAWWMWDTWIPLACGISTGMQNGMFVDDPVPPVVIYNNNPPMVEPPCAGDLTDSMIEAELAAAEVQSQRMAAQQLQNMQPSMVPVQVQVPYGVNPGERFRVETPYGEFDAVCPPNLDLTSRICIVECPTTPPLCVVVQDQLGVLSPLAPQSIVAPPPAVVAAMHLLCVTDHIVNEMDPSVATHRYLSMRRGETGLLVEGSLDAGCLEPYSDYVMVQLDSNGRIGRVSRSALQRIDAPSEVPLPPAIQ